MNPERIRRLLLALDHPISADELADALWLLTRRPSPEGPAPRPEAPRPPPAVAAGPGPGGRPREPGRPAAEPDVLTVHLRRAAEAHSGRRDGGSGARVPSVPVFAHPSELIKALRPLRRSGRSRHRMIVNERMTAERIAQGGPWLPYLEAAPVRPQDLALVVDTSSSMVLWQQMVQEIQALLRQLGAFRDIRVWALDGDADAALPLSLYSITGEDRTLRTPAELIDPNGGRVVMVLSDCVGAAWGGRALMRALELWGGVGPVCVVNVLPQRLWRRCMPQFFAVMLSATAAGKPNGQYGVETTEVSVDPAKAGIAVPVLEFDPRWLSRWAGLVAGTEAKDVRCLALLTGVSEPAADGAGTLLPGHLTPLQSLQWFQATASPVALRLAGWLAAAPLSLPVMHLVQRVMLPDSRPTHLAEVFLSGLIRRVGPDDPRLGADEVEYDFIDGVRELLLTVPQRGDAIRVLQLVSEFIAARIGSPLDFRAVVARRDVAALHHLSRPFAEIAAKVLLGAGGSLRELGQVLAEDLRQDVTGGRGADAGPHGIGTLASSPDPAAGRHDIAGHDRYGTGVRVTQHGFAEPPEHRSEQRARGLETVPPRNPRFTGRGQLLSQLRQRLVTGVTALLPQALHGTGGVGKTQLAIEYAHRFAAEYSLIWWVPAEQVVPMRSALVALAAFLGVPESGNVNRTLQALREVLNNESQQRWLLIFDNAESPAQVVEYLPSGGGDILVTSRNSEWAADYGVLEVDVFLREESISFLRDRLAGISDADAQALAEKLEDLPMALEQATALQSATGMSVAEYLRRFAERAGEVGAGEISTEYPTTIAVTVGLAIEELRRDPAAMQLLEMCSFMAAEPITRALLWAGRSALPLPARLKSAMLIESRLTNTIRQVGRYGLARVDSTLRSLQIHRLVKLLVLNQLTAPQRDEYVLAVHEFLAAADPGDPDDPLNWQRYDELAPHLLYADAVNGHSDGVRQIVLHQVRYLYARGDYDSSWSLGQSAHGAWSQNLGEDHEQALAAAYNLANALRARGDTEEARVLNEDTLQRQRRVAGDDDNNTMATANSVGADLRVRGQFEEARRLDEDNLRRHRNAFGDDYHATLRCANNLAVDLRLLGDFRTALVLDEETLRRRRLLFGGPHPETFSSISSVARDLYGLGDYHQAAAELQQGLHDYRRPLGDDHPVVLLSERHYAMALRKLGRYQDARSIAKENYNQYVEKFGDRAPDTLAAMITLANCDRVLGDLTVHSLIDIAYERYSESLGRTHPFTLFCALEQGIVLRALGQPQSAHDSDAATLENLRASVGPAHPFTLCAMGSLASDLHLLQEFDAALELSEETWRRSREIRGADHPYTLLCALNLSLDRRAMGRATAADALRDESLALLLDQLGDGHPEVVQAQRGIRAEFDIEIQPT